MCGLRGRSSPRTSTARFRSPSRPPPAAGPAPSRAGACPATAGRTSAAPATTIIRLAWVKFTDAPMAPARDAAGTGPVRRSIDSGRHARPPSWTFGPRVGRGANKRQTFNTPAAPPSRTNTADQDGFGAEQAVQPVADGDRHHQGRDQLDPHPQADPPGASRRGRRNSRPTMAAGHRAPACFGRLSAAPRRKEALPRPVHHSCSLLAGGPPESRGLLQGGNRSVKNGSPAVVSGIHRSPRAIAGDAKGRHH